MFLDRILAAKRSEIAERRALVPEAHLRTEIAQQPPPRNFAAALRDRGLAVIAEVKRGSPSRGPIAENLDAVRLARQYEAGGCAAVSVLTDQPHFLAQPRDLHDVRTGVGVPVLRKDFIIDDYQLLESRAMGADAALLIVAALSPAQLRRLIVYSEWLGLCPLVEVHTAEEAHEAVDAGAPVIGINNRDLRTFRVDLETTRRIVPMIPREIPVICESGLRSGVDAAMVASWGVDAVLVGEALVLSADPADMVRALRRAGADKAERVRSKEPGLAAPTLEN